MEKQKRKPVVVSFSENFQKQHDFIHSLPINTGISKSFWICQAIEEKMIKDQVENKLILELQDQITKEKEKNGLMWKRLQTLEEVVDKKLKVTYIHQDKDKIDNNNVGDYTEDLEAATLALDL